MKLIGPSVTIDFDDSGAYAIVRDGWKPAVTLLRANLLAGSPYDNVVEAFEIEISGDTVSADINALIHLLHEASQFGRAGRGTPVLIEENGMRSIVLHFSDVQLPAYELGSKSLSPINASFTRRGAWLNPAVETSTTSDATASAVHVVEFAEPSVIRCPVDIVFNTDGNSPFRSLARSLLLVANSAEAVSLGTVDQHMGSERGISVHGNTTAIGGQILRWTPADVNPNSVDALIIFTRELTEHDAVRDWVVIAPFLCDGSFAARPYGVTSAGQLVFGRWRTLTDNASDNTPQPVNIGRLSHERGFNQVGFQVMTNNGTMLETNYIALVAVSNDSYVIEIEPAGGLLYENQPHRVELRQQALTGLTPAVFSGDDDNDYLQTQRGNAHVWLSGQHVAACLLTCEYGGWGLHNNGTLQTVQLQAQRHRAYLVP